MANHIFWHGLMPTYSIDSAKKDVQLDTNWKIIKIEGEEYLGKDLTDQTSKKIKIVVLKIIPIFLLSIVLAPLAIPLFLCFGFYQDTGKWIRQVHYDTKIEYRLVGIFLYSPLQNPGPPSIVYADGEEEIFPYPKLSVDRKEDQPLPKQTRPMLYKDLNAYRVSSHKPR